MKINNALQRIDSGWVNKPKGFRARFDIYTNGRWVADVSPEANAAPLDSDVTAWRLAWKLAQTSNLEPPHFKEGDLVNICVIDDRGERIRSYMTNEFDVYHPQDVVVTDETGNNS
jgi:hypothetical protein